MFHREALALESSFLGERCLSTEHSLPFQTGSTSTFSQLHPVLLMEQLPEGSLSLMWGRLADHLCTGCLRLCSEGTILSTSQHQEEGMDLLGWEEAAFLRHPPDQPFPIRLGAAVPSDPGCTAALCSVLLVYIP